MKNKKQKNVYSTTFGVDPLNEHLKYENGDEEDEEN